MAEDVNSLPSTPLFAQTPQAAPVVILTKALTAANFNPGVVTDMELLFTAGPKGAMIQRIDVIGCGVGTATGVFLFVAVAAANSPPRPKGSVTYPGWNAAPGAAAPEVNFTKYTEARPLRLGPGEKLYGALGVAQANGIAVAVEASHFHTATATATSTATV